MTALFPAGRHQELSRRLKETTLYNFKTSANHQLRFTISYQLYEILILGSLLDHSATQGFNITQNVVRAISYPLKDYLCGPRCPVSIVEFWP